MLILALLAGGTVSQAAGFSSGDNSLTDVFLCESADCRNSDGKKWVLIGIPFI